MPSVYLNTVWFHYIAILQETTCFRVGELTASTVGRFKTQNRNTQPEIWDAAVPTSALDRPIISLNVPANSSVTFEALIVCSSIPRPR